MKKIRVHVYISGRVQGVGFRYSAFDQAVKFGVKGWVRNTYDNQVEAMFEGEEIQVEKMLEWCKHGPQMAFVSNVDIFKLEFKDEFNDFKIIR